MAATESEIQPGVESLSLEQREPEERETYGIVFVSAYLFVLLECKCKKSILHLAKLSEAF